MGLLDKIFGRRAGPHDPTAAWPPNAGPPPQVSLERQQVGTSFAHLAFGGDVSGAQFLGRADRVNGNDQHFTLTYFRWGFDAAFESRQLAEVMFRIGEGARMPDREDTLATPTGPDGLQLTASTTEAQLLERFGTPGNRQDFEDESILYYTVGPLVSEFLLDAERRLLGWTVYVD